MKRTAGVLVPVAVVALLGGCARIGPPVPPSLELPKPVTDLRAVRKGDKVFLSWTVPVRTTVAETIRRPGPTRICRSIKPDFKDCTVVGQMAPAKGESASKQAGTPAKAEYTDALPPSPIADYIGEFTYAVQVLNSYGRNAGLSNRVHVPTAPVLAAPSRFHLELTAGGVKIYWTCPVPPSSQPAGVRYQLRVYRREEAGAVVGRASETQASATQASPAQASSTQASAQASGTQVAEADPFNCQQPILDQSFQWEKTYFYYADIVTIVEAAAGRPEIQVEGDDTPEIEIVAHDIFPPATPSGLQAVFSGVGQTPAIDLSWNPDTEADLAGYYIYRHMEGGPAERLNSEPAEISAYRDTSVQPGKKYFYSVSAVDVRGNESQHSEEAGESVP